MEYRKYRAKTFQEAKLKMLLDVGNRAYIISQKKVKEGGIFGLFGTPMIEITAGLMEHKVFNKNKPDNLIEKNEGYISNKPINNNPTISSLKPKENINPSHKDEANIREEVDELKSLINKILADKTNYQEQIQNNNIESKPPKSQTSDKTKEIIKMFLQNEDFDSNFINTLCSLSSIEFELAGETNLSKIKEYVRKHIFDSIEFNKGISIDPKKKNIVILVGPTGVGKTTTLAKLGAYFGVFQKQKVKFISIDTYRVGAIQQLKLYADIMEIPFAKVNNVEELKMEAYNDNYDIVLIDTTGRNQKNLDEIRTIKEYANILNGKVHLSLCISATTKYKDLVEVLDKFDILNYTSIIVTKLDETNTLGQVISAISPKKRSLAYITFGQSVPEDIEEASKEKLSEMVLKS